MPIFIWGSSGGGSGGDIPNYAGRLTIHVNTSDGGAVGNTRVVVRNEKLGAYFVQPVDALGDTTFQLLENYTYHIYLIDYPATYYGGAAVVTVDSKDETTETITLKTEPDVVGWEIDQSTGRVVYTDGAVNFAPARMNYETDTFDYGSWEDSWLIRNIKPCVLKNGVVQYYLDPNDNTKKIDGTPADIESGDDGDAMSEFPMCYYKFYQDGTTIGCKFSLVPQDDSWCSNAFLNKQGIPQDVMYLSAYDGFVKDGKLRSISGKTPAVDKTIGDFRRCANANGAGYQQQEWEKRSYIFALWMMMFKNPNSQEILGKGVTSASAAINTGTMNQKGMFWGDQTSTNGVKCFGIENLWGNINKWCDGLVNYRNTYKYKIYAPFNDTASGYLSGGSIGAESGEYIDAMTVSNGHGFLPSATIADEPSSNYHDRIYKNTSDTYVCYTGGSWSYGSYAGLFYLILGDAASDSYSSIGASLSFTPQ